MSLLPSLLLSSVLVLAAPAHGEAGSDPSICLSDGQSLSGDRVVERPAHRTVRIDGREVQVPAEAVGTACDGPSVVTPANARTLRRVVLSDGQVLQGTPVLFGDRVEIGLLDGQWIHLPRALVHRLEAFPSEAAAETPAPRPPRSTETRQPPGPKAAIVSPQRAGFTTLGFFGASLLGGILFGLARSRRS